MSSFFEKLKKGMGVEEEPEIKKEDPEEENSEIKPVLKPRRQRVKKELKEKIQSEEKIETEAKEDKEQSSFAKASENKAMEQKNEIKIGPSFAKATENEKKWPSFGKDQEGQLAIDVYQTEEFLVLQSAIAGVKPESLDIVIEGDMVAIKGSREKPEEKAERTYYYQECFWGPFSRQIILSVEVDPARAEAVLKEGILTIRLPRIERDKKRKLVVQG